MNNLVSQRLIRGVYCATIFISAFLLFLVQPIISKYILPWYGGSSSVWMVSMLFFMILLLAGYLWAHSIVRITSPWIAFITQSAFIVFGCLFLAARYFSWSSPITPSKENMAMMGGEPITGILLLLLISVGLPYFLLATVSPLLQNWFGRISGKPPYMLYAVSNAGSLLAVFGYPFLIEPFFSIHTQGLVWTIAFFLFALLFFLCATFYVRVVVGTETASRMPMISGSGARIFCVWVLFSMLPVILLLATTNHILRGVAAVPLLWLMPLGLYLVAYIIVFSGILKRSNFFFAMVTLLTAPLAFLSWGVRNIFDLPMQVILALIALFFGTLTCILELYIRKPHQEQLTHYYFAQSLGGVIGALFVSIAAPLLFKDYFEYPLIILGMVALSLGILRHFSDLRSFQRKTITVCGVVIALTGMLVLMRTNGQVIMQMRNFYGTARVVYHTTFERYDLYNGSILHGSQYVSPDNRLRPMTYFTELSGIGRAFMHHQKRLANKPLTAGIIGLGTGTIAAYCKPEDVFRFYDINPAVIDIAFKYFSYLSNCPQAQIVLGDARLSLEREDDMLQFDILAIDAFTDDAIPTHLLTKEALSLYLDHLHSDGIMAFHISNKYLDLKPVMRGLVEDTNLSGAVIHSKEVGKQGANNSEWVLLSHNSHVIKKILQEQFATPLMQDGAQIYHWTDSYSNIFQVLLLR